VCKVTGRGAILGKREGSPNVPPLKRGLTVRHKRPIEVRKKKDSDMGGRRGKKKKRRTKKRCVEGKPAKKVSGRGKKKKLRPSPPGDQFQASSKRSNRVARGTSLGRRGEKKKATKIIVSPAEGK